MSGFLDYVGERWGDLTFYGYQHVSLVFQSLVLATVLAVILAALVYRSSAASGAANALSAIGLTIPSYALLGVLIVPLSLGVTPSVVALVFYGSLPIMRNAIVGLAGVDQALIESARGMGMSRMTTLVKLELPLALPIIMTGVRVSAQMMMGVAAVAAYILGPGLGGYIFQGISRAGGANADYSVLMATIGIILLAIVLDLVLSIIGRLTISRGIRV